MPCYMTPDFSRLSCRSCVDYIRELNESQLDPCKCTFFSPTKVSFSHHAELGTTPDYCKQ